MNSQTKLKYIRDYSKNCKELGDDLKWFLWIWIPFMFFGVISSIVSGVIIGFQ